MAGEFLLDVKNLQTHFRTEEGTVKAVDGVDFSIRPGETIGVVGESGCGKSVTALSIMGLVSKPGSVAGGQIMFNGRDLTKLSAEEMRKVRGHEIGMIFQEPMTSLNPVYTVGDQIAEAIVLHLKMSHRDAMDRAVDLLRQVGIPLPERRVNEYPHQLSGGMRQRVMIAMALSCNPKLLIADEPTTALDVTIQAQILELMKKLRDDYGMAIMMITHDLGVVAEMADRIVVMYSGKVVEESTVRPLFKAPMHPYTEGLLRSIPRLDQPAGKLHVIKGVVPSPLNLPPGCRFATRCPYVQPQCNEKEPDLIPSWDNEAGRTVRCIIPPKDRSAEEAV